MYGVKVGEYGTLKEIHNFNKKKLNFYVRFFLVKRKLSHITCLNMKNHWGE